MSRSDWTAFAGLVARALLSGSVVAVIVFALAYAQEQAWNNVFSLGPDWIVAGGMAALAFCIVFVKTLDE